MRLKHLIAILKSWDMESGKAPSEEHGFLLNVNARYGSQSVCFKTMDFACDRQEMLLREPLIFEPRPSRD